MSFREKSILITMASLLVAAGAYTAVVIPLAQRLPISEIPYQPLLIVAVVILTIVIAAGHVVAAILQPRAAMAGPDERERVVEWRGQAAGGYVLAVAAFIVLCLAIVEAPWFWIANVLAGMWVLAEIFAGIWKAALLRRGA